VPVVSKETLAPPSMFANSIPSELSPDFKKCAIADVSLLMIGFSIYKQLIEKRKRNWLDLKASTRQELEEYFSSIPSIQDIRWFELIDFKGIKRELRKNIVTIPLLGIYKLQIAPKKTKMRLGAGEVLEEEGESLEYRIRLVRTKDKLPEGKEVKTFAEDKQEIITSYLKSLYEGMIKENTLVPLAEICVKAHLEIAAKFKGYEITIRDFKALVGFVQRFSGQGIAEAFIRGVLYVYGDRLKLKPEKKELNDLILSYKELISKLAGEDVDIESIISPAKDTSSPLPVDNIALLKRFTLGLEGKTKEFMDLVFELLEKKEGAYVIACMELSFLPDEIGEFLVEDIVLGLLIEQVKKRRGQSALRRLSLEALAQFAGDYPYITDVLIESLGNDGWDDMRVEAAKQLGLIGIKEDKVISALILALDDAEDIVINKAAEALGKLGATDKRIIDALCSKAPLNSNAVEALAALRADSDEVIEILFRELESDKTYPQKLVYAKALRDLGIKDSERIRPLYDEAVKIFKTDKDDNNVRIAAELLGKLWIREETIVDLLLEKLAGHEEFSVRLSCAVALRDLGFTDQKIIDALCDRVKNDGNWLTRDCCLKNLHKFGIKQEKVIETLIYALEKGETWSEIKEAAYALRDFEVEDPRIVPALHKWLKTKDSIQDREVCAELLAYYGIKDKEVIATLRNILENEKEDKDVRKQCAMALGSLGIRNKWFTDLLTELLRVKLEEKRLPNAELKGIYAKVLSKALKPALVRHKTKINKIYVENKKALEEDLSRTIQTTGSGKDRVDISDNNEYVIDGEVSIPILEAADREGIPDLEKTQLVLTHTTVDNMKKIIYAAKMKDPLLLIGPTATGKSAPIKYLAAITNNKHMAISMNPDITSYEAIGGYKPNPKKGENEPSVKWEDGFLVKAMEEGYWLTLEELNLAPTEVLELLNFYLVHGYLKIMREGEEVTIKPDKNFRLFATMNPEYYSSRNRLSKALMGRFRCKWFGMLPDEELAEIINVQFGLSQETGLGLLQMHHLIAKEAKEGDIGKKEKERYEYNLRDLLRLCNRLTPYIDEDGKVFIEHIAREFNNVYLDRIRDKDEREAVYLIADNVLKFSNNGVKYEQLLRKPVILEQLDPYIDALRQGSASEKWGQSPVPSGDASLGTVPIFLHNDPTLAPIPTTLGYMKKVLQTLAMDSRYKEFPLLVGPTASSKTSIMLYLAYLCNVNLHYINLDQDSPIEELIGGYVRTEERGRYEWKDGLLVKAMREGSWIFIDEFNMSELPEYFNTVIDDGYIVLPTGERVTAEPTFRMIGAMNPPEMEGRNILSPALRSRMTEIWIGEELSEKELKDIFKFYIHHNKASEIAVKLHLEIIQEFSSYDITIRDLMGLKDYIKDNIKDKGLAEAMVRGVLYIYADKLKTKKEIQKLNSILFSFKEDLENISREKLDIIDIIDGDNITASVVPDDIAGLIRFITKSLTKVTKETDGNLKMFINVITALLENPKRAYLIPFMGLSYLPDNFRQFLLNIGVKEILMEQIQSDDRDTYEAAIKGLGKMGLTDDDIIGALIEKANIHDDHMNSITRGQAVEALAELGVKTGKVIDVLIDRMTNDSEMTVRYRAATALAELGVKDNRVVNALCRSIRNDNISDVTRRVGQAFVDLGVMNKKVINTMLNRMLKPFTDSMTEELSDTLWKMALSDRSTVWRFLDYIIQRDEDQQDELLCKVYQEKRQYTYRHFNRYIPYDGSELNFQRLSKQYKGMLDIVIDKALRGKSQDVRKAGIYALNSLGYRDERVVNVLLQILRNDSDEVLRKKAAEALGDLRVKERHVITTLKDILINDKSDVARNGCTIALAKLGIDDAAVIKTVLKRLITSHDKDVQVTSAGALVDLEARDEKVIVGLCGMLTNEKMEVRMASAEALGKIGVANENVVEGLLESLVHDEKKAVQCAAARALGALGVKEDAVVNTLLAMITARRQEKEIQIACVEAIGEIGVKHKTVIDTLINKLEQGVHEETLTPIIRVFGKWKIKTRKLIRVIRHILERDSSYTTKQKLMKAILEAGIRDREIVESILNVAIHYPVNWTIELGAGVLGKMIRPEVEGHMKKLEKVVKRNLEELSAVREGVLTKASGSDRVSIDLGKIIEPDKLTLTQVYDDPAELFKFLTRGAKGDIKKCADAITKILAEPDGIIAVSYMDFSVLPENLKKILTDTILVDNLIFNLENGDEAQRKSTALALGALKLKRKDILDALIEAVRHDTDDEARRMAVLAIGDIGSTRKSVMDMILERLEDEPEVETRQQLVFLYGNLGKKDERIEKVLLKKFQVEDPKVRAAAAEALGNTGLDDEEVIGTLLIRSLQDRMFFDTSAEVRAAGAEALGRMQVERPDILHQILFNVKNDDEEEVRAACVVALGRLWKKKAYLWKSEHVKTTEQDIIDALLDRIENDEDGLVVEGAVIALGEMRIKDDKVVDAILKVMDDKQIQNPDECFTALANIGVKSRKVITAIIDTMRTGSFFSRYKAAKIIGELGVKDDEVIQALLDALSDEEEDHADPDQWSVREQAARSLKLLGVKSDTFKKTLRDVMEKDKRHTLRAACAEILYELGERDGCLVDVLLEVFAMDINSVPSQAFARQGITEQRVIDALTAQICGFDGSDIMKVSIWKDNIRALGELIKKDLAPHKKILEFTADKNLAILNAAREGKTEAGSAAGRVDFDLEDILDPERMTPLEVPDDIAGLFESLTQGVHGKAREFADHVITILKEPDGVFLIGHIDLSFLPDKVREIFINTVIVTALLTILEDDGSGISRSNAIETLVKLGIKSDEVIKALFDRAENDGNWVTRADAAKALVELGIKDERLMDCLLDILENGEPYHAKVRVVSGIGKLGLKEDRIRRALIYSVINHDSMVRLDAAREFTQLGFEIHEENVLQTLFERIKDPDEIKYIETAVLLNIRDPRLTDILIDRFTNGSEVNVRMAAGKALGELEMNEEKVLQALYDVIIQPNLNDDDKGITAFEERCAACIGLSKLKPDSDKWVHRLIHILTSDEGTPYQGWDTVQNHVSDVLCAWGKRDTHNVDIIINRLKGDDSNDVKRVSANTLGRMGLIDDKIINALMERLHHDPDMTVKYASAVALGNLKTGEQRVSDILFTHLMTEDEGVLRSACADSIGATTKIHPRTINGLIQKLAEDEEQSVRVSCAGAMGELKLQDKKVRDALLEALSDKDIRVRSFALKALGSIGIKEKRVKEALLTGLKDKENDIKIASAIALENLGDSDEEIIQALVGRLNLEDEDEYHAQYEMIKALGSLGVKDGGVVDCLLEKMSHENIQLCILAAEALMKLGVKNKEVLEKLARNNYRQTLEFTKYDFMPRFAQFGIEDQYVITRFMDRFSRPEYEDRRTEFFKAISRLIHPEGLLPLDGLEDVVGRNMEVFETALATKQLEGTGKQRLGLQTEEKYFTIDDEISLPIRVGDTEGVPSLEKTRLVHTHTTVDNMKKIMYAVKMKDPLLLIGPTATGKSAPIKYLAAVTNNKHMSISMNPDLTSYEAIGGYKPNPSKDENAPSVSWEDGFLIKAMEEGYWLTLEELNLAPTEVLELLNFYLVHGYLKIVREGEEVTIKPHKDFRLFATMNPEHYSSRNRLSKALMGRFRCKWFGMLPDGELAEIINVQFGLSQEVGMSLLQMHHLIVKEAKEGDIGRKEKDSYEYNLRDLLRLCNRLKPYIDDDGKVSLKHIAEEFNKVYLDRIRDEDEREALYVIADNVLKFSTNEIKYEELISKPNKLEELQGLINAIKQSGLLPLPEKDPTLAPVPTTLGYMKKILETLMMDTRYKEFPLLVGPTASSKTSLILYLAYLCNIELHYINLDQDSAIEELIGGYVRTDKRGRYEWKDGLLVKAMREGSWIFIDEFNMSELPEYFNTVIDDGYIILPTGEKVTAEESFRMIGAMNPPDMAGRNMLSPALKSRMTEIWIGEEYSEEELIDIFKFYIDHEKVSEIVVKLHLKVKEEFGKYEITIRDLIGLKDYIKDNIDVQGMAGAIVRGILYVYGDRFKKEDEKSELAKFIMSHKADLESLSDEEIDIEDIIRPERINLAQINNDPRHLFRYLVQGAEGRSKSYIDFILGIVRKPDGIRYLTYLDCSFLPDTLRNMLLEGIVKEALKADLDRSDKHQVYEYVHALYRLGLHDDIDTDDLLDLIKYYTDVERKPMQVSTIILLLSKLGRKEESVVEAVYSIIDLHSKARAESEVVKAMCILGAASEYVADKLLGVMKDDIIWQTRKNAAEGFGKSGLKDRKIIDGLIDRIENDKVVTVSGEAASALGNLGVKDKKVLQVLLSCMIESKYYGVKGKFLEAVGKLVENDTDALKDILDIVFSMKKKDGFEALDMLLGNYTLFLKNISDKDMRKIIIEDDRPVRFLTNILSGSSKYHERNQAAAMLGQLGEKDETIIKALINGLTGKKGLHGRAATALAKLGVQEERVLTAFEISLAKADTNEKPQIIVAIGALGIKNIRVKKFLLDGLNLDKDDDVLVRTTSALALGELQINDPDVMSVLLDKLDNDMDFVKDDYIKALGRMGIITDEVRDVLLKRLKEAKAYTERVLAIESIKNLGFKDSETKNALIKTAIKDGDWRVTLATYSYLGKLGLEDNALMQKLIGAFETEERDIKKDTMAKELGKLGVKDKRVLEYILRMFEFRRNNDHSDAAEILIDLGMREEMMKIILRAKDTENMLARYADKIFSPDDSIARDLEKLAARNAQKLSQELDGIESRGSASDRVTFDLHGILHPAKPTSVAVPDNPIDLFRFLVGDMGEEIREYEEFIVSILEDPEDIVLLADMDLSYLPETVRDVMITSIAKPLLLAQLLYDTNTIRRSLAAMAIANLGIKGEDVKEALFHIVRDDEDDGVKPACVRALGNMGAASEEIIDVLFSKLYDGVDIGCATALGKLGLSDEKIDILLSKLDAKFDPKENERKATVRILTDLGIVTPKIRKVLLESLEEVKDAQLRSYIVNTLADLFPGDQEVMEAVLDEAQFSDDLTKDRAVEALGKIGIVNEDVIRVILDGFEHDNWIRRQAAIFGCKKLGSTDSRIVEKLYDMLVNDDESRNRSNAAEGLYELGFKDKRMIDAMIKRIKSDTNHYVRAQCCHIFAYMGVNQKRIIDALLDKLKNDEDELFVRQESLRALGMLKANEKRVIDEILGILSEDMARHESLVYQHAIWALGDMEADDDEVKEVLMDKIRTGDFTIRQAAVKSLSKILKTSVEAYAGDLERTVKENLAILEVSKEGQTDSGSASDRVTFDLDQILHPKRMTPTEVLENPGKLFRMLMDGVKGDWEEIIDSIATLLEKPNGMEVIATYGFQGFPERIKNILIEDMVIPCILDQFRKGNSNQQRDIAKALGVLGRKDDIIIDYLIAALLSPEAWVMTRERAAEALREIGVKTEKVKQALIKGLEDGREEVRVHVVAAIGVLEFYDKDIINALKRRLKIDRHEGVIKYSAMILGKHDFRDQELEDMLYDKMCGKDSNARGEAMEAISQLKMKEKRVIDRLLELLEKKDEFGLEHRKITETFARLGVTEDRVVDALMEMFEGHKYADIAKYGALMALGELSRIGIKRKDEVIELAIHELDGIRIDHFAAYTLGIIGEKTEKVVAELFKNAQSSGKQSSSVRNSAIIALQKLGAGDEEIVTKLKKMVATEVDCFCLESIVDYLKHFGAIDVEVINTLIDRFENDKDGEIVEKAASCLGDVAIGDSKAVTALFKGLAEKDEINVRSVAAAMRKYVREEHMPDSDEMEEVFDENNNLVGLRDEGAAEKRVRFNLDEILHPERVTEKDATEEPGKLFRVLTHGASDEWKPILDSIARVLDEEYGMEIIAELRFEGFPEKIRNMFIKEIVIPKLLDKLANAIDTDKSGAASALGALGEKNKEVIEALVNALLHEQYPITREHAAQALGEIGVVNDEVVEALAKGLKAQHNEVRMGCLEAVAKLDLKQEVVRDALIHLVKMRGGEDWHCRKAAGILAEHEFDKTELINELYERTKVRDFQTQQRAVIALGKLAINNEKVIKRLIEIINIWLMNTLIIRDTAFAFCNMEKGDKRVSDALINYLEEERGDDIAKSGILRALGVQSTLGVKDTRTRKHALKQLKSDHYKDSGAICLGLLGEKDEEVINALFDCAVSDASMWARSRAIDALGYLEVEDEKIITKLKKMVATEEDDDVLKSIMDVLKHLDKVKGDVEDRVDEGVRQTIETRVDPGQGLGAMKVVADCLVKISNDDEKTVRLLFDALSKDFSAYDKEKIARALRKILRPDILPDGDELLKVFDKNNALSGLQSSGSARGRVNFDLDDILRPDRITPLSVPEDPIELLQILTDGQGGGVPLLVDTLAEIFASDNKHKFLNIMDLSYLPDVLRRIIYDEETLDEMIRLEIKDRANGSLGSKGFIRMAEVDEHIEQKVFNALITADNDKDKQGAIGILEGIGLRNERIMDSLIMMMRGEKSFTVRRALILMFWRIKNPNEALIRELTFMAANDEDHYIRQTAVGALAKLGKDDAEVKNILFRRLGNEESPEVKVTIARNLAEVFKIKNDEIVAILEESLLKEESGFSRERLARVLRDMDALSDDYVQRLLNIVFTEVNKDKKKNALFVLAEAGIQNEKVIKDLCDKVPTYDDPKVVAALMAVLGKSGIKTETVMKRLLESLNDERGIDVRDTAMRAIIKLELTDKRVIDTLIGNISNTEGTSVYKTQDHAYRLAELSAFALGKLGIKTESVTQALLNSCKNDKRYRVAEASAVALNELGIKSDELIDILIEKIEERDYFMQGPAAQVLGMIGRKDKKVVDALLEALQADVRAEAKSLIVHALDELEAEGDEVEKVLVGLIDSKEPVMVREVAVFGLQNILKRWIKPNVRDLEEAVSRNVARLQAALLGKTAEGSAEKRIAFDLDGILRPERIIPTQVPENPADLFMFLTQGVDHEFDGLREVIRDLLSQPDQIHLLAYLDLSWLPESVMDIIIKDYVINEMADRLGETGDLMSEYVKNRFIWALGEFGIKNDKVVEALKYRAMHDNESSVIGSAIRALATLNLDEDEIKDFLYDLFIHNEEDSVRDPVCMALSKLGLTDERIIKICLAKMAEHPDDIHEQIKRKHMTGYVSHAGRGDPRVIQALINGLVQKTMCLTL